MDLIIVMGAQIHNHQIEKFRKTGSHKKVISYKCGNNYVIAMENILFGENPDKKYQFDEDYDEILADRYACIEFRFCAGNWYILSSDGLKNS